MHYTTPNWGGFTGIVAYSSNPTTTDGDMVAGAGYPEYGSQGARLEPEPQLRRGQLAGRLQLLELEARWRHCRRCSVPGSAALTTMLGAANQVAHRLYGDYTFGFGLKIGLAWD